jgi:hypothetical protein
MDRNRVGSTPNFSIRRHNPQRQDCDPSCVVTDGRNAPTNWSKPSTRLLRITVTLRANYLGVSRRFASSCTDFVVADLSIADWGGKPQAAGGFVICLANTR